MPGSWGLFFQLLSYIAPHACFLAGDPHYGASFSLAYSSSFAQIFFMLLQACLRLLPRWHVLPWRGIVVFESCTWVQVSETSRLCACDSQQAAGLRFRAGLPDTQTRKHAESKRRARLVPLQDCWAHLISSSSRYAPRPPGQILDRGGREWRVMQPACAWCNSESSCSFSPQQC